MPLWFSKAIEYWNPEQPPPTTPMRSPAGSGSWVAMISRTLAIACGVRNRGAFFSVSCAGAVVTDAMVSPGMVDFLPLAITCLLYTSDAADEEDSVDLGGRR